MRKDCAEDDAFAAHVGRTVGSGAGAEDSAGNADCDGGCEGPLQLLPDAALLALLRRVLFLSRSTRVECFCEGAAAGAVGDEVAAAAQPLEAVVAPCIPPRPGRDG